VLSVYQALVHNLTDDCGRALEQAMPPPPMKRGSIPSSRAASPEVKDSHRSLLTQIDLLRCALLVAVPSIFCGLALIGRRLLSYLLVDRGDLPDWRNDTDSTDFWTKIQRRTTNHAIDRWVHQSVAQDPWTWMSSGVGILRLETAHRRRNVWMCVGNPVADGTATDGGKQMPGIQYLPLRSDEASNNLPTLPDCEEATSDPHSGANSETGLYDEASSCEWMATGASLPEPAGHLSSAEIEGDVDNIIQQLSSILASLKALGQTSCRLHILEPNQCEFSIVRGTSVEQNVHQLSFSEDLIDQRQHDSLSVCKTAAPFPETLRVQLTNGRDVSWRLSLPSFVAQGLTLQIAEMPCDPTTSDQVKIPWLTYYHPSSIYYRNLPNPLMACTLSVMKACDLDVVHIFIRSPIDAVSESVVAKLVHAKFIVSTQDQAICSSRPDIVSGQLRTIERLEEQGILHSLGDYRSRGVATVTQDAVVLEEVRVGLRKPKLSFRSATETSATVVPLYNQFPDPLNCENEVSYSYFMCWWRSEQEMKQRSRSWKDDQECLDSISRRKQAREAKESEVKALGRAYRDYKRRQSNGRVDYTLRLTETHRPKPQELPDAGMYQNGSNGNVNDLREDHSEVIKAKQQILGRLSKGTGLPTHSLTLDWIMTYILNDLDSGKWDLESTPIVVGTSVRSNLSLYDEFRLTPRQLSLAMKIAGLFNSLLPTHRIPDIDFSSEVDLPFGLALCPDRESGLHKLPEGHSPPQKRPYKRNWQPQKSRKLEQKIRHTRGPYRGR
jgi:hypothetical protein